MDQSVGNDIVIPMDKLAKAYRRIRAQIDALTAEHETKVAGLKLIQDQFKNAMKTEMQKLGVKSMKTVEGTVILSEKTRYYTQDWESMKEFIKDHNAIDLLEKRIAQRNMAEWLREHPKLVPPGLNSESELEVSVRKP